MGESSRWLKICKKQQRFVKKEVMFMLFSFLLQFVVEIFRFYSRLTVSLVWFYSSLPGAFCVIPALVICVILKDPALSLPAISPLTAVFLAVYFFSIAHFVLGSLILYYVNENSEWRDWTIDFLSPEFVFSYLGGPQEKTMHNRRVVIVPTLFFALFLVTYQGVGLFWFLS